MRRNIFRFVVFVIIGTRFIALTLLIINRRRHNKEVVKLFNFTEARVYCQDSNARPWMPLGSTCPVICASIRNAIDSLMMSDYKNTIKNQLGRQKINNKVLVDTEYLDGIFLRHKYYKGLKKNNDSISSNAAKIEDEYNEEFSKKGFEIKTENKDLNTNDKTTLRPLDKKEYLNQYSTIFKYLKNAKGILRRSNNNNDSTFKIINKIAGKCWYMEKFTEKILLGKIGYRPCTRKSNFDVKFIQIMTNILNKYADSLFKFTDEMTEILLDNIFGSNTDLRNNILDVNKLLKYLRKSVDLHNNHSHGLVVTLESKHCLTLSMPGCFCKPGYVESDGQCVHPSDCVSEKYNQYLARIIVL